MEERATDESFISWNAGCDEDGAEWEGACIGGCMGVCMLRTCEVGLRVSTRRPPAKVEASAARV